MWPVNTRTWVTVQFFVEWVNLVFGSDVKEYLQENNLCLEVIRVLYKAPAQPPNLEGSTSIKFLYLPSNITPILLSTD